MVSIMFTLALSVVSVAAFIGNALVATTFLKTRSLRTSTNYYIVNMAVSDLLASFFNWPLYASEGMLTPNVFINEPWASSVCKMGMYFRVVSQVVSVLSLILIAVDRFVAIVYPLKVTLMNVKIRVIFVSLTWLIPIFGALPYVLFARIIKVEDQTFCRFMMSDEALTVFLWRWVYCLLHYSSNDNHNSVLSDYASFKKETKARQLAERSRKRKTTPAESKDPENLYVNCACFFHLLDPSLCLFVS